MFDSSSSQAPPTPTEEPLRVLGIDPGLSTTGYGVVEAVRGNVSALAAGVITTDREASTAERLVELYADLVELIAEHAPAEAAIEQVFVNKNLQTAMSVARASGVAMLAIAQYGAPLAEYTPSAVKAAVAGYGSADKAQMQSIVAMRLGLNHIPEPADAADALAIAMCHLQHSRQGRAVASTSGQTR